MTHSTNPRRVRLLYLVVVKGCVVSIDTSVQMAFTGHSSEKDLWFNATSQPRNPSLLYIAESGRRLLPVYTWCSHVFTDQLSMSSGILTYEEIRKHLDNCVWYHIYLLRTILIKSIQHVQQIWTWYSYFLFIKLSRMFENISSVR